MMQKLKKNWLVSSKLRWGISWILIWQLKNLKNLHFNWLPLTKVYNVWAKKSTGELCLMALNTDTKFEGKVTFSFKNDKRNLGNFHQKASKFGLWWDSFIQSRKSMILKLSGELFVMTMKKDPKLEEELTCCFKIDMRTLMNFVWPEH